MPTFSELVEMVLKQEGVGMEGNPTGLVEIPGDPGGLTNWGISQRMYRTLRMGHEYHVYQSYPLSVKDLTKEQALVIYEQEYWNKIPMKEDLPFAICVATQPDRFSIVYCSQFQFKNRGRCNSHRILFHLIRDSKKFRSIRTAALIQEMDD